MFERSKFGHELTPAEQQHVLAAYVHRYTGDHMPSWARGKNVPVQFASDQDWLRNTEFAVLRSGALNRRVRYCYSHPTWPNNPELRQK